MKTIDLVKEWHEKFGVEIKDSPDISDEDLNELRIDLIAEEFQELIYALGNKNKVAALDALTDLQYVLDGAYLSLGFHKVKDKAFLEVHKSNMSKLNNNGSPVRRYDGKILKGENYRPPNLKQFLKGSI